MSNFLIGCVTFVILVLIVQIKNIFKNSILKKSIVEAVKEISIKALENGSTFEELDLKIFEKMLGIGEEDE